MSKQPTSMSTIRKVAYSSGNFSVNLISQTFGTYIVFYYVDVLGVKPTLISLAMVIHGIFNAILNPFFGYLSDRTQTRFGRRLPYMLFGMVPLATAFTLIWHPFGRSSGSLFWYFLFAVLVYDILFVLVVLNWTALFPEMFHSLKERAAVSAWRQMLGIVGMILGVAIPPLLYGSIGWSAMGLLFGVLCLLVFALSLYGVRENSTAEPVSYNFLQALRYTFVNKSFVTFVIGSFLVQFTFVLIPAVMPFFSKYVLHIADWQNTLLLGTLFVVAIPMVYVWGRLIHRLGARKTVLIAVFLFSLALIPFGFVKTLFAAVLTTAFVGFNLAGVIVLLDVLLAEVIDEDEKRSGARREGMYFGMNGFVIRWGVSLQAVIMGAMLEKTGYSGQAAVQTPAAVAGFRAMLTWIPMIALLLALVCFFLYPIRPSRRDKQSKVEKNSLTP